MPNADTLEGDAAEEHSALVQRQAGRLLLLSSLEALLPWCSLRRVFPFLCRNSLLCRLIRFAKRAG